MRLPGFIHRKGVPFQSRIVHECPAQPYARDELVAAFGLRVNGHDHARATKKTTRRDHKRRDWSADSEDPGQRPAQMRIYGASPMRKTKGFSVEEIRQRFLRRTPPLRPAARRRRSQAAYGAALKDRETSPRRIGASCKAVSALSGTGSASPCRPSRTSSSCSLEHAAWRGKIYFDEFYGRIYPTESAGPPQEWSDPDDIRVTVWLQSVIGIDRVSVATVADAVRHVANAGSARRGGHVS